MEDTNQTISSTDKSKIPLLRSVGLTTGILMVAGIMIGSGVFKKIVPMAQSLMSETWILLAWIIAGVITMFGAFTYAGLASLTKESGGVYEYLRLCFGNFFSFLFGWTIFMIGGSGAIAALAFVFSQSVNTLVNFPDPLHAFHNISIGHFIFPFASSGIKIFGVITIGLLTWLNYLGIKKGSILNNIVTAAKIFGIVLLIISGLFFAGPSASDPVTTTSIINHTANSSLFAGLFGALLSALWAYDGWANITYITGEIKNPQRNVPVAIMAGVGIAMTLYVLLNAAYMHVMPLQQLATLGENKIAAAEMAGVVLGKAGTVIIALLIMICTFGALNACIIVYPRLYYRMAQENFFFKKVARVHPVFRTPYVSLIYSLVWSCILVLTGTFDQLTNLVIFSGYLFFGLVTWGLISMKRKGIIKTKVIGYPVIPIIIILFSAALVVNTIIVQPAQSAMGLLLVLSGVPLYYYFKKQNASVQP
jgi:basic amino acid/polyamine antiporter, APA family